VNRVKARPHGLWNAAITEALDLTGGDVRAVQRFSRHRDVRVLQRYDDSRRDLAGDVARRVAGG
jgi:integrase/recombinase XerC